MSRNNINTNPTNFQSFISLTDTPKTYAGSSLLYCQVKNDESGLQFAPASGTGVTKFTELQDVPSSYSASANYQVVVNGSATGLVFIPNGDGVTELIQLSDCPNTYSGQVPYNILNINGSSDGVRFSDPKALATNAIPLIALQDCPISYGSAYQYLGVNTTETGLSWQTIPPNVSENTLNILDTFTTTNTLGPNTTSQYSIDLNYVTVNDGFTITLPIQFSPTLTETFSINWAYTFDNNKASNVTSSSFQSLEIQLLQYPSTLIQTIFSNTYPTTGMSQSPNLDTHTESGTINVSLTSGVNYFYKINFTTATDVGGTYIPGDKIFDTSGRLPVYIVNSADYDNTPNPPYGSANQVLTSNGTNLFSLQSISSLIGPNIIYEDYGMWQSNGCNGVQNAEGVIVNSLNLIPNELYSGTNFSLISAVFGTFKMLIVPPMTTYSNCALVVQVLSVAPTSYTNNSYFSQITNYATQFNGFSNGFIAVLTLNRLVTLPLTIPFTAGNMASFTSDTFDIVNDTDAYQYFIWSVNNASITTTCINYQVQLIANSV